MHYYAVIADIHGNLAALRSVARDARAIAAADGARLSFICLGDVVDYGPQPRECVAWVRRHAALAVVGNHDQAALAEGPPLGIDEAHWPILIWTRAALDEQARAVMASWPQTARTGPFAVFHSSIAEPDAYINNQRAALACLLRQRAAFGLFGHTHVQGTFVLQRGRVRTGLATTAPEHLNGGDTIGLPLHTWLDLGDPDAGPEEPQALLNPGSVGQPRRHAALAALGLPPDTRACSMLLREPAPGRWQARFQRVAYPVETTARRLEALRWDAPAPPDQPGAHPLERAFAATRAAMPRLLPSVATRLAAQLRG